MKKIEVLSETKKVTKKKIDELVVFMNEAYEKGIIERPIIISSQIYYNEFYEYAEIIGQSDENGGKFIL